eukprot:169555_1
MLYVIMSAILFFLTCFRFEIKKWINWFDDYVFHKIFGLDRMQVVGYRRLRTLSQLCFESIPQILLQVRILMVAGTNENQELNIDTFAVILSVAFSLCHLFLEFVVLYLDSSASRMTLTQYCIVCLGARLNWIPYSHIYKNI